jgi:hypothetical protein
MQVPMEVPIQVPMQVKQGLVHGNQRPDMQQPQYQYQHQDTHQLQQQQHQPAPHSLEQQRLMASSHAAGPASAGPGTEASTVNAANATNAAKISGSTSGHVLGKLYGGATLFPGWKLGTDVIDVRGIAVLDGTGPPPTGHSAGSINGSINGGGSGTGMLAAGIHPFGYSPFGGFIGGAKCGEVAENRSMRRAGCRHGPGGRHRHECGYQCSCSALRRPAAARGGRMEVVDCGERKAQQRISWRLVVFKPGGASGDLGKGWGVRCLERVIDKGSFLFEYVGELRRECEVEQLQRTYETDGLKGRYFFTLTEGARATTRAGSRQSDKPERMYVVDATRYRNIAAFVNHSCRPNLEARFYWTQHTDRALPHVGFYAARDIHFGEELGVSYAQGLTGKARVDALGWLGADCRCDYCREKEREREEREGISRSRKRSRPKPAGFEAQHGESYSST